MFFELSPLKLDSLTKTDGNMLATLHNLSNSQLNKSLLG